MAKARGHTRIDNDYLRAGSNVKGSRLLLLIYLDSRADKSRRCWPTTERISEDLDMSLRTVFRGLSRLEDMGLILRNKERDSRGQWGHTVYEIADLRQGPGAFLEAIPSATMADGPSAKPVCQIYPDRLPNWQTNNNQDNKTHKNNPRNPHEKAALEVQKSRALDPDRDVPGWGAFKACAKRAEIEPGQLAEQLAAGLPPAFLLGYLLEKLRKRPIIRKSAAAWLADKCKRRRAPAAVDYDAAKRALRPFLDRVALPGMRFGDLIASPEREPSLEERKRKALEGLDAGGAEERRA